MPFYEQVSRHSRKLAYAIEVITPVLATVLLVWMLLVTFQHADERARAARAAQVQSCKAVKTSNDGLEQFLHDRIRSNPTTDTPDAERFLRDLHTAYMKAEAQCLVKP